MDKGMESEVIVLVQKVLREELAPIEKRQDENHKQNRVDIHDLRQKMQMIANEFHLFMAELRGREQEKKEAAEKRDELMAVVVTQSSRGTARATWALVVATIILLIVTAIGIWIAANHTSAKNLIGADPSVADYYDTK